jgi:hypothetical protein
MKRFNLLLVFIGAFTFSSFAQLYPEVDTFYHRLMLANQEIPGLTVNSTYIIGSKSVGRCGYAQNFSFGLIHGTVRLLLAASNRAAADSSATMRMLSGCELFAGVWNEFKVQLGDSSWYGDCPGASLYFLNGNLAVQIVTSMTAAAKNRAVTVSIAQKILRHYFDNAIGIVLAPVSEPCSSRSVIDAFSVWNNTADSLDIDSIKMVTDAKKYPKCAVFFMRGTQRAIEFLCQNDSVREILDCVGDYSKCKSYDYNKLTPADGFLKLDLLPGRGEWFMNIAIDTRFDTIPKWWTKSYCADSLKTIEAKLVFYCGKYTGTLTVTGWINNEGTVSAILPAYRKVSVRQKSVDGARYDPLGRKIVRFEGAKEKKSDIKNQVYLKSKP